MNAEVSASVRSQRKPKGEGHERRAEILAAAERIFVEHGYEGATIRKIADEVGLSSTALYMHFPDKGAILQEISREAFETLLRLHRQAQEEAAPAEHRLRRMLLSYVEFGFSNPNAYHLVYMTRPPELRDGEQFAARELGLDLFRSFEQVVEELDASGRLRIDARTAAQALWAGGHGVVSLMISKPYFEWVDREALATAMVEGLLAGFVRP